ncbi:MAG: electron transfer flavoprotein subunit beta/FixA family protein [Desulfobacterota bacterium]|nr:electron transfer flavoprotein subunit beta/FixA family protein [Thermodesulfobacteriota bacterium]MDW8002337.1 electron transfer flavoprotein subunit beta/FixA family protein [Deltaproteobacteria bacterium]
MNILVFVKRVQAAQEEELRIVGDGERVDLSKLPYKINDWDNYALEEACRTVEKLGGQVTAITIGDKEADEVLRRSLAMGAKDGLLLEKPETLLDPVIRASLAYNFLTKEKIKFDVILTGVQAEDDQYGVFGGYLAALLSLPYVSLVCGIEEWSGSYAVVRRELEGGLMERVKVDVPCVLSIQTGINEPRYVSIMGIRKASQIQRKVYDAHQYMDGLSATIEVIKWSYPPRKEGATLLSSDIDTACREILNILREKGVYQ